MSQFGELPLYVNVVLFLIATLAILFAGTRLAKTADRLADLTGLGEAFFGALFLGGSTSLSGIVTSVTAAAEGHAELAVSNALGGIAAQTVFLGIADITYRKANLEHASASEANLVQGTLLTTLLSVPLLTMAGPEVDFWGIHPTSIVLIIIYIFGLRLISKAHTSPMWVPEDTEETVWDEPEGEENQSGMAVLWLKLTLFAVIVGVSGYVVARTGVAISESTGFSETVVGALFTAVSTSLPELVTAIAAAQSGALTLAVGNVFGGNCFDLLFLSFSDIAYRDGSIYHAVTTRQVFIVSLTILLTSILLLGLLRREKYGIANIGFESFLTIVLYLGAFLVLFLQG